MRFLPNFFPYSGHSEITCSSTLRKDRSPGRPLDAQFQRLNDPSNRPSMPLGAHALSSVIVPSLTTNTPSGRQGQPEKSTNHVGERAALALDTPAINDLCSSLSPSAS